MKYHPPATSPYSPHHRALVHQPTPKKNHRSTSFIILYLLLKFWDKPLLQKVFQKISIVWDKTILSKKNDNFPTKVIVTSGVGKRIGKGITCSALFLARCLIKVVASTKVDKLGILEVPCGIQSWVQMQDQNGNPKEPLHELQASFRVTEEGEGGIADIIENNKNIDLVLKYWFGQSTPEKSQKQLWMIASSSMEHMKEIDAEIYNVFGDLLIDLSECDSSGASESDFRCRRKIWTGDYENDDALYSWRGKLAAIIVLDQMSRHIHRHFSNSCSTLSQQDKRIPEQKVLDAYACRIAQDLQIKHADDISCGMIPTPMMIFALMPLRHRSTIQSVGFVQKKVEEISSLNEVDMDHMIRRFRRATNRRMAFLQDEARREGKRTQYQASASIGQRNEIDEAEEDFSSIVKTKRIFSEEDILEFHFFEADTSDADKTPLIRTMKQYLEARGIYPCKSKGDSDQVVRDTPVIVSLSGGVDSMVIANALAYLRDHCGFRRLYIVAVHIDYGNRPESAAEASFVEYYARDILKVDKCTIRRINEVTRGVTKRDEYEKVSRNLRYDLYRQTVSECREKCGEVNPNQKLVEAGVMLGHHRGDVVENVISNSNKGCGPLDLSGMTSLSKNDGVTIYRPLLPLEKKDVYDFSHKYGVPYFKDTTPHWSTRGKLRNKLVPLLEEIYGDGCLRNLASLAKESDEARDLFQKVAFRPFLDKVKRFPMGLIFSTKEFSHQGSYFWKTVLRELLHSAGLGMFGDKATDSFLKRVFARKMTAGWLQCRKDYAVYLIEDGRVMVLYPDNFPWRKTDQFGSVGKGVPYGKKVTIGPWEVLTKITPNAEIKEAFSSWEEFMSGELQYCLEVPISTTECKFLNIQNNHNDRDNRGSVGEEIEVTSERSQEEVGMQEYPAQLEFIESFNRQSRPLSWKGFDLRIQSTLPLVGNGKDALNKWIAGEKTVIVTVKMKLKQGVRSDANNSIGVNNKK